MACFPTRSTYEYTLGKMLLSFIEMAFFYLECSSNTNFVAECPRRIVQITGTKRVADPLQ
jgi:hypothetical protein